jgi:hypothetical protein
LRLGKILFYSTLPLAALTKLPVPLTLKRHRLSLLDAFTTARGAGLTHPQNPIWSNAFIRKAAMIRPTPNRKPFNAVIP